MNDPLLNRIRDKCLEWEKESARPERWKTGRAFDDKVLLGGQTISIFDPKLNTVLAMNGYENRLLNAMFLHPFRRNISYVRLIFASVEDLFYQRERLVYYCRFTVKPKELAPYKVVTVNDLVYVDQALLAPSDLARQRQRFDDLWRLQRVLATQLAILAWLRLLDQLARLPFSLQALYVASVIHRERLFERQDDRTWLAACFDVGNIEMRYHEGFCRLTPPELRCDMLNNTPEESSFLDLLKTLEPDLAAIQVELPITGKNNIDGFYLAMLKQCHAESNQEYSDGSTFLAPELLELLCQNNDDAIKSIKGKVIKWRKCLICLYPKY